MHYKPLPINPKFNEALNKGWNITLRQEKSLREKLKALQNEHRTKAKD